MASHLAAHFGLCGSDGFLFFLFAHSVVLLMNPGGLKKNV